MSAIAVGICLFLAGVVGYLVVLIRRYIVAKIGQVKYDATNKLIEDIVRYVEQMGVNIGWGSEDKKRLAINLCHSLIEKLGYEIDEQLLEVLIERAVQVINESSFAFKLDRADQIDRLYNEGAEAQAPVQPTTG